jgi:hypothetical protein
MDIHFDPQTFFFRLGWWEWLAIAAWGWVLIWLLESRPPLAAHPIITGIASFATVWGSFTYFIYRSLAGKRKKRRKSIWLKCNRAAARRIGRSGGPAGVPSQPSGTPASRCDFATVARLVRRLGEPSQHFSLA